MNQLVPSNAAMRPDPLIEQSVAKANDFLRSYSPMALVVLKDTLQRQYRVEINNALPEFNLGTAKAYAATDLNENRSIYALVCENSAVIRHGALNKMLMLRHPNFVAPLAAGVVELSQPDEERYVVFFERPKGKKLSTLLEGKNRPSNVIIIDTIIKPIVQAILALSEAEITHGTINIDNIYYESHAVLGPCVSEPCGYSQPFYYELVERIQANPAGKGEYHAGADLYALGVLALELLFGKKHFERFTPELLSRLILRKGNYDSLTAGREPPENFFDFLWGMLGTGGNQRWNYRYLKPWLEGKHYSVAASSSAMETAKPYDGFETTSFSRREIAHLIANNWNQVAENLSTNPLTQWVLSTLRQKDYADLVAYHSKQIIDSGTKNENLRNENILKLILLLDNDGPLRYTNIALHIDGIDSLFADAFFKQNQNDISSLTKFLELNLTAAWVDLQRVTEREIPESTSKLLSKYDKMRSLIRSHGIGFGPERLLYELNPNLPCLSPLCRGKYITGLTGLLKHLDKISPNFAASQDPMDAHIGAFLASKLGIQSEIKLHDLASAPTIATNKSLIALKLFAVAQHRSGNIELSGLTHWIASRILPSMQYLHSQTLRGRTLQMLLDEALEGRTQRLGDLLLDGEIINADQTGYQKAFRNYKNNAVRIDHYKRATNVNYDSAHLGGIIAKIFAYMVFLTSIYRVFSAGM